MSEGSSSVPDISLTQAASSSPKHMAAAREFQEALGILSFRIASCPCANKEKCKLYQGAQTLLVRLGKLQEVGEGKAVAPISTGKKGRGKGGSSRGNL